MAHERKLTVNILSLYPGNNSIENSIRNLFLNKLGKTKEDIEDTELFLDICQVFIKSIDNDKMYSDEKSKKSMTANQKNLDSPDTDTNVNFHTKSFVIEGTINGGPYGKKLQKISRFDKSQKDKVGEDDVITDDYYFFLHIPFYSNRAILMTQSYTDSTIDSVINEFMQEFLSHGIVFKKAKANRFVPKKMIDGFKRHTTVSGFQFVTNLPGETLLESVSKEINKNFKVEVKITPIGDNLTIDEFNKALIPIERGLFNKMKLGSFQKRKASLKDEEMGKPTNFELGSDFEIKPQIFLDKYIDFGSKASPFKLIKDYCFKIMPDIVKEINLTDDIQER